MTCIFSFNKLKEMECRLHNYCLKAFAVNNGWTTFIIFLLGNPHLLEGGQGSKDGSTDPDGVFPLGGSDDLDLHGGRSQGDDFLGHPISHTREHGGTSGQHVVGVKVLADVNIALHDGVVGGLGNATGLHSEEGGLEQSLSGSKALVAKGDDLTVGKLVCLLNTTGCGSIFHLLIEVQSDVAELLLDVTDNFTLGGGGEGVTTLSEDLHEVVSDVTAGQVQTGNGVGESVTLKDWDVVGDTISGVEDAASGTSRGVQGKHGLDGNVDGGGVHGLKHYLHHLLSVGLGVEGSLSEHDGVLFRGDSQLVVQTVVPELLHIVPVCDDAMLDGVFQSQNTSL